MRFICCVLYLVFCEDLFSQFTPNTDVTLNPHPVKNLVIDGVIEDAWKQGEHFDNWVESWPIEGREPAAKTEGWVTYDDDYLYFAFICHDPDMSKLRASITDRDNMFQDDFVGINIDLYGDFQTSYEFFVNPRGIQGDLIVVHSGNGEDESYDAVWDSEAHIYDSYWTAEMRIPFKSLRYPRKVDHSWLLHMHRIYPRESRFRYSWMLQSQDNSVQFTQAGKLKLAGVPKGSNNFELLPYVIGSRSNELKENSVGDGKWPSPKNDGDVGIGVKYGLASNITLDAAYNPDFSQIEADAGQIDINNNFALFYREKRPFFLEGSDIFQIDGDINLIYTRSINDPLYAAKITGKANQITFGLLSAYDQNTPVLVPFEEFSEGFGTTQNSWNNIARVKYDVGNQRYFGITATDRRYENNGSNTVLSTDTYWALDKQYAIRLIGAYSHTKEPTDSLLESDETFKYGGKSYSGTFDGESFNGFAARGAFKYDSRNFNYWVAYQQLTPTFRADEGFVTANHVKIGTAWAGYTFRFENHPLLNYIQPNGFIYRKYNYDGKLKDFGSRPQINIGFQNQTEFYAGFFALNNENFRGKQFDGIHRGDFQISYRGSPIVQGGVFVETGYFINRRGKEGDPYNPFIKAKGTSFNPWMEIKATSRIRNVFEINSFSLYTHYGGSLIRKQWIYRNTLTYQFSKKWFLRLIGEYVTVVANEAQTDDDGNIVYGTDLKALRDHSESQFFSVDPLISYKINPFTVFFVGAHLGGESDPYPNRDGLSRTNQSIFVKFQYFMRI